MSKRRSYNWPELIAQFEQSGLSQTQFCKQHDLNAKYFGVAVQFTIILFTKLTIIRFERFMMVLPRFYHNYFQLCQIKIVRSTKLRHKNNHHKIQNEKADVIAYDDVGWLVFLALYIRL